MGQNVEGEELGALIALSPPYLLGFYILWTVSSSLVITALFWTRFQHCIQLYTIWPECKPTVMPTTGRFSRTTVPIPRFKRFWSHLLRCFFRHILGATAQDSSVTASLRVGARALSSSSPVDPAGRGHVFIFINRYLLKINFPESHY